ncbi:MAG: LPS kinase Kdo/WaaP, partial [Alistipes sp.]|nr:LPS kinase Kdo/WaaP [Alistipes sp.]
PARFAGHPHDQATAPRDFPHGNVLWRRDAATGAVRFQLIDINRMRFADRPLRPRVCMVNLRRLSCPAVAFLYILDRYAEARGWNVDDTLLQGTFFRLAFERRKELRKRFRHRKR